MFVSSLVPGPISPSLTHLTKQTIKRGWTIKLLSSCKKYEEKLQLLMVCKSSLCYHRILLALTLIIKYIGDDNMYTIPISSTLVLLVTLLLNWLRILFQALLPYYTSTFAIYPLSLMKYVCNSKASLHLLHTTPQMHMCSLKRPRLSFNIL